VKASLRSDGPLQTEDRPFSSTLSAQEAEDFRWYLEDYRIYPVHPAPTIAKRIEQRMSEVGRELFRQVLAGSDVWSSICCKLAETRIEIETEVGDALVPWELMRDPVADLPLALAVHSFVRCHARPAQVPSPPGPAAGNIRILLVICRLDNDPVPFRSVARQLIRGLSDAARGPFDLEVLRPPTFEQLAKRLRAAKAQGEPFHAVHFDGHGDKGVVYFENSVLGASGQPVYARHIGELLNETGVSVLTLNACRSADSEPPEQPEEVGDLHEQIRQFGSFAHTVMDYGASGVLAWRYSVYVKTAARYMAGLYGALASGLSLGEAATLARRELSCTATPIEETPIEDWTVPVVFEAAPFQLFPKSEETLDLKFEASAAESGLPHAPVGGFIGRDETLLKLDRTFNDESIVLLEAYAGSGKTSAAVDFARWYTQTGGTSGDLFTSFEQHKPLSRVLDDLGRVFEGVLEENGIKWLTLDEPQRREVALQVLRQFPVLWIWDNVELIAGFPALTPSAWSAVEQNELVDFLRDARGTKAKFLLTSRRDERDWLLDLPARIKLPPMPFDERIQMTEELAESLGRRLEEVEDWRPLLRFTQGNPMTLMVLVRQALRDRLKSREQITRFVCQLQAGEEVFEDEASEGRTRSLAASLAYGFENAFTEAEQKQLALLHLFQGFVHVDALRLMGHPEAEWCLPEVKDLTRESGNALFDRAAEVGLLTALEGSSYKVHPAVPWFFRRLFEQCYSERRNAATRAFVEAMGRLGEHYHSEYEEGNRNVIGALTAEEANLLRARSLARSNGWWDTVIGTMQGLRSLYGHGGQTAEWSHLVEEIVPDFVDPETLRSLPGREQDWDLVTEYLVLLSEGARRWEDAELLQRKRVSWNRERTLVILAKPPSEWDATEKDKVRSLVASVHELSDIQREQGRANSVEGYLEALSLAEQIQDYQAAASCAFNLGHAYEILDEIRDLPLAEQWYGRSLELLPKEDRLGRAQCLGELGTVAYRRFRDARKAKQPDEECLRHFANAEEYYTLALKMFPADAVQELATIHNQLGALYANTGQIDTALRHYRESITICEAMKDRFGAGQTRYNTAVALARAGRFVDAREWAQSALPDFQACENTDQEIVKTVKLLEEIESALQASPQPS